MRFFSLFRTKKPPPAQPKPAPASLHESPQPIVLRTLVIVYDPVVSGQSKLSKFMNWNRVDDLMQGFISDIEQVSGGLVRYQIVEQIDVDAFPAKVDGYVYDASTYLNVWRGLARPYMPQEADYHAIVHQFGILPRVANDEIDEVWIFNFPHAGFYESMMAGPGAFWCNAPPLANTEASARRFVIMGFSYERGVGEMLENMGHRAESIMEKTFERTRGEANLWKRFTRYNKTHPGRAALGNVHFAPNSVRDYDWGNPSPVLSECDDWLYNFPDFKGLTRKVTAADWGYGDTRQHHLWWMKHFPKIGGQQNGIQHNWWQYIANPNYVKA
jgi:hypothetical protein